MKKLLSVVVLSMAFIISGCSSTSTGSESGQTSGDGGLKRISIATASTSGAWYPLGGAWANLISENVEGYEATAEVGAASLENIRKLDKGNVELAFLQPDVAFKAYNGSGAFKDTKMDEVRALLSDYKVTTQIVTLEGTKVGSIEDLKGKKVGVGAPGSGTEGTNKTILDVAGFSYDDVDEQFLSFPEMVEGLKDKQLDVAMGSMPVPTGVITDLSLQHKVKLLPIEGEVKEKFLEKNPYFIETVIPAGSYKNVTEDINTLAFRGVLYGTTRLSEEDAYQIVKTIWENKEKWEDVHSVTKDINFETAFEGVPTPLHAGAVKYYQEKGLEVPDELIPPEMK